MSLLFADQIDDVSEDPAEIAELLDSLADFDGGLRDDIAAGSFLEDPDPGYDKPSVAERVIGSKGSKTGGARKPSAAVRKDIRAKVAIFLSMGGTVWESRDAHCGGALLSSVPETSDALTDIFCDSPDIVNWFTASGKYMKWLNLAAALQPVAATMFSHHVSHSLRDEEPGAEPDWSQYRAGG